MSDIWTEKYRPKNFEDIKGQDDIVRKVKAFVEQQAMPHLLFTGPAGVGKTSLSLVIARKLFGDNWRENFLELNASDDRGIDVVRNTVKDFARTRAIGNVPFKIIYLDECDALTREAQQALRRTMENYVQTCRFILSANYASKILDPIQSRCAVFKFKPLAKEHVLLLINKVAEQEKLLIDDNAKEALIFVSEGDCRRVENILQSCAAVADTITEETVYSMASSARPQEVRELLQLALTGDFIKSRNKLTDIMHKFGLSGLDIIKGVQKEIWNLDLDGRTAASLVDTCGEIEFRMVEGSDEFIQLEALLARISVAKK